MTTSGRLDNVDGKELRETMIELSPVSGWHGGLFGADVLPAAEPRAVTVATTTGHFSVPVPRIGVWQVTARAAGYLPVVSGPDFVVDAVALPPAHHEPARTRGVEVRDGHGRALAGARLFARAASAPRREPGRGEGVNDAWRGAPQTAVSDETGRAEVQLAGHLDLSVIAEGFAPWHGEVAFDHHPW